MVSNAGLPETSLPLIYLFGGAATFVSSPFFGKLSDRYPNYGRDAPLVPWGDEIPKDSHRINRFSK